MRAIGWMMIVCVCSPFACTTLDRRPVTDSTNNVTSHKRPDEQRVPPMPQPPPLDEPENLVLPSRLFAEPEDDPLPANAVVAARDPVHVKVGQPVLFKFGYVVIPSDITHYKMAVDGVDVPFPEDASPRNQPLGYCRTTLVYRPKTIGKHRVDITSVRAEGPHGTDTWTVVVSE